MVTIIDVIQVGLSRVDGGYTASFVHNIARNIDLPAQDEYTAVEAAQILNRIELGYIPEQDIGGIYPGLVTEDDFAKMN